ncbi:MAG: ABC transporter ATP-binding protein [Planctomycetes bacterium]|nr:ABC transporter ATP-binding protein [Planctomycetota bacterium]
MSNHDDVAVETVALTRAFGKSDARVEALRGIDLKVPRGQFLAVMGPSGSGKSTLLHVIGGLSLPTSGTVQVQGHDLATLDDDQLTLLRRRRVGFIFQSFNLIQVLTAEENVALPLVIDGRKRSEVEQRVREVLELVDLGARRHHLPAELSGGEQQRVAIARALVMDPALVLADEPTGNLDSLSGEKVMRILRRLVDTRGLTLILVTHNSRDAAMADRLVYLRDGRIVEEQILSAAHSSREVLRQLEELA